MFAKCTSLHLVERRTRSNCAQRRHGTSTPEVRMNSRGRGRSRAKPHARRGIGRPACRRCAARRRRRSNQYIRLPTTPATRLPERGVHVRHASAAGQTRKVAEAAAASGHGGVPLAAMAAGRDVPASEAGGRRQQHTRFGPVAGRGQAASGNRLAGRRRPKYPSTYVDARSGHRRAWQQNQRKRFYSHELGIERMKGLRSKRV